MNRSFTAETWTNLIGKKYWYEAIDEANDLIEDEIETDIQGYDIDGSVVQDGKRKCRECRSCPSDPFSGACSERSETSKEVDSLSRILHMEMRLEDRETLPQIYREFGDEF